MKLLIVVLFNLLACFYSQVVYSSTGVTTIQGYAATALDSFVFQTNAFSPTEITVRYASGCVNSSYTAQGVTIVGNTLQAVTVPPPSTCPGANLTVYITYPESVTSICINTTKGLYCADSYFRSIPADSPKNFQADDAGFVYDNLQGLMWTSSPLTPFFTNPSCCGQGPDGDQLYVNNAEAACNAIGAGWRLATRSEHHRLMDHTVLKPAMNTNFFTVPANKLDIGLWTRDRSVVNDYILNAYVIYSSDGGITYDGDVPKGAQGAFCVKTIIKKLRPVTQYIVSPSTLTAHDTYTGLVWTRDFVGTVYTVLDNNAAQVNYCNNLVVDGFSDWRLPTIKDLHSDFERGPIWNHTVFKITDTNNDWWWASTPHPALTGYSWAWTNGDGVAYINVSPGKARCVRRPLTPTNAPIAATPAPTTKAPTVAPTTLAPTNNPTTLSPTSTPTTLAPTTLTPTNNPTQSPTLTPTTNAPTNAPTTASPTANPTTLSPTTSPTNVPVGTPTETPTQPTTSPTSSPTTSPTTASPTFSPTNNPTTILPTETPTTKAPANVPTTLSPTANPTSLSPTEAPTELPLGTPTEAPTTELPTSFPTLAPVQPTITTDSPTDTTNAPANVPTDDERCHEFSGNCLDCLSQDCTFCPALDNPNMNFRCVPKQSQCNRQRVLYCEDTNSQISANWTSDDLVISIMSSPNRQGINLVIKSISNPVTVQNLLRVLVGFNSTDSVWGDDEKKQACEMIITGIAKYFSIDDSRLNCSFLSLSKKRIISDGEAQIFITEPSQQVSNDSGFPMWVIAVAVVGGVILLVALVALIYLVVSKNNKENWEKY